MPKSHVNHPIRPPAAGRPSMPRSFAVAFILYFPLVHRSRRVLFRWFTPHVDEKSRLLFFLPAGWRAEGGGRARAF